MTQRKHRRRMNNAKRHFERLLNQNILEGMALDQAVCEAWIVLSQTGLISANRREYMKKWIDQKFPPPNTQYAPGVLNSFPYVTSKSHGPTQP